MKTIKEKMSITAILLAIVLTSCFNTGKKVTKKKFGDQWPFTVDQGHVKCLHENRIIFHAERQTYGVNDIAKKTFFDIEKIWRTDIDTATVITYMKPIVEEGMKRCKTKK